MNISKGKLGNEECEQCQEYFVHMKARNDCCAECKICQTYKEHKAKARHASIGYRKVADLLHSDENIVCAEL